MNTLEVLEKRSSVREFSGEVVSLSKVKEILHYAKEFSPSSIGAWQVSFVIVQDKEKLAQIAELAGGQDHIISSGTFVAVVADFNRTNEAAIKQQKTQVIHETVEGLVVGSVDVGLYTMCAQMAVEHFGLGSTIIGGIRKNLDGLIKLLDLPDMTLPVIGFTIGEKVPNKDHHSPRMGGDSVIFVETYDRDAVKNELNTYDDELKTYFSKYGMEREYSDWVSSIYSLNYNPNLKEVLEKQGFKLK